MPNETPDWKKGAIIALSQKYGYRAIANRLDIDYKTARRYIKKVEDDGMIEMSGQNLQVKDAS